MGFFRRLATPTATASAAAGKTIDHFAATSHCIGPWSPKSQHGGPPAALLMRCVERLAKSLKVPMVTHVSMALFRPVPIEDLRVETSVVKGGAMVSHLEASMFVASSGKECLRMRAVCLREAAVEGLEGHPPPPSVTNVEKFVPEYPGEPFRFPTNFTSHLPESYIKSIELHKAEGTHAKGPTTLWFKVLRTTVGGEEAQSPMERLLTVADSCGGISYYIDFGTHTFLNPDLSLTILRAPRGEDIAMAATTMLQPGTGSGIATCNLYDRDGLVGVGSMTLLLQSRL